MAKTSKSVKGKKSKKGNDRVVRVNFEGVESSSAVPEDNYHVKILSASQEEGQGEHNYIKWEFEVAAGKFKGKKIYNNTSLSPAALWNLRNLMEALEIEIPDSEMDIDLDEVIDKELMISVIHEDYEGRAKAKVSDYGPLDGEASDDDEEAEIEDEDEEEEKPKKGKKASKKDDDEDEEEEESDDEETSGLSTDEVKNMSTKELKDLIKEHKLKVKDFDELGSTRKKRDAVIKALDAKGLLED